MDDFTVYYLIPAIIALIGVILGLNELRRKKKI